MCLTPIMCVVNHITELIPISIAWNGTISTEDEVWRCILKNLVNFLRKDFAVAAADKRHVGKLRPHVRAARGKPRLARYIDRLNQRRQRLRELVVFDEKIDFLNTAVGRQRLCRGDHVRVKIPCAGIYCRSHHESVLSDQVVPPAAELATRMPSAFFESTKQS